MGKRSCASHRWSSWTGWRPSSLHRTCTAIAIMGCWRRTLPGGRRQRRTPRRKHSLRRLPPHRQAARRSAPQRRCTERTPHPCGRCCGRESTSCFRWSVRTVGRRCGSSPLSPIRGHPHAPAPRGTDPATAHSPRARSARMGGTLCPEPGIQPLSGGAGASLRIRPDSELVKRRKGACPQRARQRSRSSPGNPLPQPPATLLGSARPASGSQIRPADRPPCAKPPPNLDRCPPQGYASPTPEAVEFPILHQCRCRCLGNTRDMTPQCLAR
jgi:hypothetical protein